MGAVGLTIGLIQGKVVLSVISETTPGWHPFNRVQWVQDQLGATRRITPWLNTKIETAAEAWLRGIIASWRQNWSHYLSVGRARYSSEMDINLFFSSSFSERRLQIQINPFTDDFKFGTFIGHFSEWRRGRHGSERVKYRFWKTGDAFDDVFITNRGSLLFTHQIWLQNGGTVLTGTEL